MRKKPKSITLELRKQIENMLFKKLSSRSIARELDISHSGLIKELAFGKDPDGFYNADYAQNIRDSSKRTKTYKVYSKKDIDQIRELRSMGMPFEKIAEALNTSVGTAYTYAKDIMVPSEKANNTLTRLEVIETQIKMILEIIKEKLS